MRCESEGDARVEEMRERERDGDASNRDASSRDAETRERERERDASNQRCEK